MNKNKIIGDKIRNFREEKNISVDEMAARSGIGVEQIKRIEGNEDFPSLAPLIKIARVLGVRLGTFLDDQTALGPVISRKRERKTDEGICFTNDSASRHKYMFYHALSNDKPGRHMEPFLINIEPSGEMDFVFSSHEGEEFIFVINGSVEINYGKNTYILNEGDSIYYDSIVSHHVHAGSSNPATIIGVIYTPY